MLALIKDSLDIYVGPLEFSSILSSLLKILAYLH